MRKTLLIAAAALASGVISSQAQVYSQNIVGYVNIPEMAGVLSLESVPLDLDGTGTNNTLATVFSSPTVGDNLLTFNSALGQFVGYNYTTKSTGIGVNKVTVTNWYNPSGAVANSELGVINPGQGFFYSPAVNKTNTYVGTVLMGNGTLTNSYLPAAGGEGLVASQLPIAGGVQTTLNYQPHVGDNVLLYSGGQYVGYNYTTKTTGIGVNKTTVTNWYAPSGSVGEPQISVGQGFFLNPSLQRQSLDAIHK